MDKHESAREYPREMFLDELEGQARAARAVLSDIGNRAQWAGIHNQFLFVDLEMDECTAIREALNEAESGVAKLRDVIAEIYNSRQEDEDESA